MAGHDDTTWLNRLREGDNRAFEELFKHFYAPLCSFVAGYVNDEVAAEDIVQDVFFKLLTEKPTFENIIVLKSYLYRVAHNQCLNYLKHQRVREDYASMRMGEEETTTFFNRVVEQELLTLLEEAIRELPSQTGQVMELTMEGLDNAEIAERLNLSMDAVKSHKKRGRQFLRNRLEELSALLLLLTNC